MPKGAKLELELETRAVPNPRVGKNPTTSLRITHYMKSRNA